MQTVRMCRLPVAIQITGFGPTKFYSEIKAERMTPPIKLTARSSAWPEHELDAINRARMAGKSDGELKQLVKQLVAARSQAAG